MREAALQEACFSGRKKRGGVEKVEQQEVKKRTDEGRKEVMNGQRIERNGAEKKEEWKKGRMTMKTKVENLEHRKE